MTLKPSAHVNVIWGSNGQGKTNLLEALYVAMRGKSFRPYAHPKDWFPTGSTNLEAHVRLENERGFACISQIQGVDSKIKFYLDEKRATTEKMRERVPIVVFSPDDHALIRQGPEERRNFLDDVYGDICPG